MIKYITNFFVICSGANRDILKQCSHETTKFVGIGSTIFFTSLLSTISGGYAIFFTFNSLLISILFGIIWGLVIFSLDRYIVSSINKPKIPKKFDTKILRTDEIDVINEKKKLKSERHRMLSRQFWSAFPRILISLVLAITISKPLEIKLFDGTISKKLGEIENTYNNGCEDDFNNHRLELENQKQQLSSSLEKNRNTLYLKDPIFLDLNNQQLDINKEKKLTQNQINSNQHVIIKNTYKEVIKDKEAFRYNSTAQNKIIENKGLQNKLYQKDIEYSNILEKLDIRKTELIDNLKNVEAGYAKQISSIQNDINSWDSKHDIIISKCKDEASMDKDILSRLRALELLKEFGNTVWFASLLITLLFILLETAPVTVKLLSNRGSYDETLDKIQDGYTLLQKQELNTNRETYEQRYLIEKENFLYEQQLSKDKFTYEQELNKEEYNYNLESLKIKHDNYKQTEQLISEETKKAKIEVDLKRIEHWKEEKLSKLVKIPIEEAQIVKEVIIISEYDIKERAELISKERNQGNDNSNWFLAIEELKKEKIN